MASGVTPKGLRRLPARGRARGERAPVAHLASEPERILTTDRLSPRIFERVLCAVEVVTVIRDAHQRPLPLGARYSRVARIVERKAGGSR
jgi:hypothetical protein